MNGSIEDVAEMAIRHLSELEKSIDRAVRGRADWGTILALKAAARAYRKVLKLQGASSRKAPTRGVNE